MALKTIADIPTPKRAEAVKKTEPVKKEEELKTSKTEVMADEVKGHKRFATIDLAADYFRKAITDISRNTLQICYEMGQEMKLIIDESAYGEATVETFAQKLQAIDPKRLYKYAQFARMYTPEDVKALLTKKHIGWGAINKLLAIKEPEARVDFENKLDSGKIAPSKLEEAIRDYKEDLKDTKDKKSGKGEKSEPNRNYVRNMKKLMAALAIVKDVLEPCIKDVRDMDQMDSMTEAYTKVSDVAHETREALDDIWVNLTALRRDVTKVTSIPETATKK